MEKMKSENKTACTEINESNFAAVLRQIEMASSAVYAHTKSHGRPGNHPTLAIQKGFPVGANFVCAENTGLQFYSDFPIGSEKFETSEFVQFCAKRWPK